MVPEDGGYSVVERLLKNAGRLELIPFWQELESLVQEQQAFFAHPRGNTLTYTRFLEGLPDVKVSGTDTDRDRPRAGRSKDVSPEEARRIREGLMGLSPWRKGPFELFGIDLDSEWRSNLKWNRLVSKITPLTNRKILDIGSSNGYYMLRMAAHAPRMVLGLEPQHTFYFQYLALQRYFKCPDLFCLPVPFDGFPVLKGYFDTVFLMGVLYHRRSPLDMLRRIREMTTPGGEIIVENLIIESDEDICLCPRERYAKMRNIFFIPTVRVLTQWLLRSGFGKVTVVDISRTCQEEQRKTPWINTESLNDFLDPLDAARTVEGYPAPVRAVLTARAL